MACRLWMPPPPPPSPTRMRMTAKYGLAAVPPASLAASPALRALHDDEAAWRRYEATRALFVDFLAADGGGEAVAGDGQDDDDDDINSDARSRELVARLRPRLGDLLREEGVPPPAADALLAALSQQAGTSWDDDDCLGDATVQTLLWSPRALPTGVGIVGTYHSDHHGISSGLAEHCIDLHCRPLPPRTPWKGGEEDVTMAEELGVAGIVTPEPWRLLLKSSCEGSPVTSLTWEREDELTTEVDVTCADGLSPTTARHLRKWLYGPPAAAGAAAAAAARGGSGNGDGDGDGGNGDDVSDHALLRFVVVAGLALGADHHHYTGPVWDATPAEAEMRAVGVWAAAQAEEGLPSAAPAAALRRSWVDHALRLAAGTPRTADRYYEPPAVAAAKTAWGARVLAAAAAQRAEAAVAADGGGGGVADHRVEAWTTLHPGVVWGKGVLGRLPPLPVAGGGGGANTSGATSADAQAAAQLEFMRRLQG